MSTRQPTTDPIGGGPGNDHLIHHRDFSLDTHADKMLAGYADNDVLEGSIPYLGQIHMNGATGDDGLVLNVTKTAVHLSGTRTTPTRPVRRANKP